VSATPCPCLPARTADVVAFLAAERGRGMALNTLDAPRRDPLPALHRRLPGPTAEAAVAETLAGDYYG